MDLIYSVLSFVLAISVLITVHEGGHFLVARWLGVKVLRFSVGFGRPLWSKRSANGETEYVLAAIPLGGYVKMLDEREGAVAEHELDRAFNRKPLGTRIAVVAAGPGFNFLFAILAYWGMYMSGINGLVPLVAEVEPKSPAALAGIETGDRVVAVNGQPSATWERVIQLSISAALDGEPVILMVKDRDLRQQALSLDTSQLELDDIAGGKFFDRLGVSPQRPVLLPVMDRIEAGSPAEQAGLLAGDRILKTDEGPVETWGDWVEYVRAHGAVRFPVTVQRGDAQLEIYLTPMLVDGDEGKMGRIGAGVQVPDELDREFYALEQYGALESLRHSLDKTAEVSLLTVRMLWKMLQLEVSAENLSGPISIARYAGHSAQVGLSRFLEFLAIVSVSLGILNLLPIPVLDGGHLMYYLIELLRSRPVSEQAQMAGQRVGIAVLVGLMSLAIFNDLTRLFN